MKTKQPFCWITMALLVLWSVACGGVKRIQTNKVVDISGRWNDTDARLVAEEMVKNVISQPWLSNFVATAERPPVLIMGEISNKSHEHIEGDTFIKDIERELINSQTVRIITNGVFREKVRTERREQEQGTPATDVQKKYGRELGADLMLFGTINTIVDSSERGKERVIFYQVTLELTNLVTNEVVWMGDKKIKKYVKR